MTEKPNLPPVLAAYFAAQNAHDIDAIMACFSPAARVRDEGEDIVGHAAIRDWKQRTSAKYKAQAEPLQVDENQGGVTVIANVSGNFPGSPANLTFRFGLADGAITALEIG